MREITGYKFNNENAARNAQSALRVHYLGNRPAPPDGETWTTTEWVDVYDNGDFWFFLGDYAPVLGNPETFNVDWE